MQGTTRISTATGTDLAEDFVLEALEERESRRRRGANMTLEETEQNEWHLEYRLDFAADCRRLVAVAPQRSPVFTALREGR